MLALLTGMAGLVIALVAAGCGGHGSTSQKTFFVRQGCIESARDTAEAEVVSNAYRAGGLGSAATVRAQVAKLAPLVGVPKTSFLRADGTFVPWRQMTTAQRRTFLAWEHETPSVSARVQSDVLEASNRAAEHAKSICAGSSS